MQFHKALSVLIQNNIHREYSIVNRVVFFVLFFNISGVAMR